MSIKNLHVYIIHSKRLTERRKVIDNFRRDVGKFSFSSLKVSNIDVIETYEPEDITSNDIQSNVNYNPLNTNNEDLKMYNQLIRILHINNISNAMKHFDAIKKISECTDDNAVHLVIEDDVMYENRMCMLLDKLVRELTDEEIVFLGMPNNEVVKTSNIVIKDSKDVFKILPYNDSYIINKNTAERIVENFLPVKYYTNIQLSYLCNLLDIKVKQSVPNIFVDGSKYGSCVSSQIANNELVFNKEYMYMKSLLMKSDVITKEEITNIEKIKNSSSIMNNPDLFFIIGKVMRDKLNDYKAANEIYQNVFDSYKRNNAILNNESIFIRDFINLQKHLQIDVS